MTQEWTFSAVDTLFFKESRPIESVGGSQLSSLFPPPARTVIGAIRTAIGEAHGGDWTGYKNDPQHPLRQIMGTPEALGPLQFCGPYLMNQGKRLFPLPLNYLESKDGQTRLLPAPDAVFCDLGRVQLPVKQNTKLEGAKPKENAFISAEALAQFLGGNAIPAEQIFAAHQLFAQEERLGIARDNRKRVTGDGLLYQTRHIRPISSKEVNLQIGIKITGLDAGPLPENGMVRLGAEGRLAAWQRRDSKGLPMIQKPANATGLLLMLLTPARFSAGWCPDGFVRQDEGRREVWIGEIAGIRLKLISCVVGKPQREGGWDLAGHAPRDLLSLVPAGSCYFCELVDSKDLQHAQKTLHGLQIGQDTEYGRGELAVGYW
ncbi:type III-B CRISPR module-associated protein Cmr3 [Chitinilyticum piscinae]|uniref:Type III-B CRISPR module-associated protein Cmr3 n=1 Tax=Chitinilyticum piscinae TaxID=2866724 RepID=A0A8J7K2Q9_9NEIS|nr:type III-B CRISPR module-associated protein Cmr3 [Chitinilyticum piscinae]MBE9610826.1 type III-B CRISPR module-associated protein Cmr3 [Chitinilyticum piscinae]